MIIPNGEDVVMDETVFNQDPAFFINLVVGSCLVGRAKHRERIPVDQINYIGQRLQDEGPTWELYRKSLEILI